MPLCGRIACWPGCSVVANEVFGRDGCGPEIRNLILAGGAGVRLRCFVYRERLMPTAMGITGFIARLQGKVLDRPAIETAVGRLLRGWDALLEGGWHGPVLGALLNTGFEALTLAFLFWLPDTASTLPCWW